MSSDISKSHNGLSLAFMSIHVYIKAKWIVVSF